MKIYDCFTFYNEFELLELRFKSLWEVVDCFVLVEADKKHTNEPKPYYFWERQEDFKKFWSKIRHLPVEMTIDFKGVGDWSIENAQRDAIAYGLEDAAPDDLILISDLDEIPAPDVVQKIRDGQAADFLDKSPLALEQKFFYYYFDWISPALWIGTIITKQKNLTTPQELRKLKDKFPRVSDGGYHFSYMGGVERVIDKMTSIVEGPVLIKYFGEKVLDRKHIEQALANGTDIYGRKNFSEDNGRRSFFEEQMLSFDAKKIRLPHLDEFLRKYPHFLREPEKYFTN